MKVVFGKRAIVKSARHRHNSLNEKAKSYVYKGFGSLKLYACLALLLTEMDVKKVKSKEHLKH